MNEKYVLLEEDNYLSSKNTDNARLYDNAVSYDDDNSDCVVVNIKVKAEVIMREIKS